MEKNEQNHEVIELEQDGIKFGVDIRGSVTQVMYTIAPIGKEKEAAILKQSILNPNGKPNTNS